MTATDRNYPRILTPGGDVPNLIPRPIGNVEIIEDVEVVDRVDHLSMHGAEVKRTFLVTPYRAWPQFVGAKEGFVHTVGGVVTRKEPDVDPYTKTVWTDAIVVPVDSDGISPSESLEYPARVAKSNNSQIVVLLNDLTGQDKVEQFYPGALVTGIYRPVMSLVSGEPDETATRPSRCSSRTKRRTRGC